MSFPCLICGDLPVVGSGAPGASPSSSAGVPGRSTAPPPLKKASGSNGTTIRTLSKDVSDKIFQNLCRHLSIKTEPYWFIQNPGEQMPLCAICSGSVLEMYTWQSKIEQFQAMIKKHVWKLERMVADTEIASNWMATREEQEMEEAMWNSLPCPPMAIRIARERHHKFRQQILQNFKNKVKIRQKMRATGHQSEDFLDMEFDVNFNSSVPSNTVLGSNGDKQDGAGISSTTAKRPRLDVHQNPLPQLRPQQSHISLSRPPPAAVPISKFNTPQPSSSSFSSEQSPTHATIKIPSTIAISTANVSNQEFVDESEYSDSDNNSQVYPDVQIICSGGSVDFMKEETEQDYSNSGDGEESGMEHDSSLWNLIDDNMEGDEPMVVQEGEEALWLASDVALRKSFVEKLLTENLKPSVFLRKLTFALFGLKQLANSSGICGSSKPGSKPSVDKYKFEALREYTVDTYGIRENFIELEDLNRKIRTICCDARKALKRRLQKPAQVSLHPTPASMGVLVTPIMDPFSMGDEGEEENEEQLPAVLEDNSQ